MCVLIQLKIYCLLTRRRFMILKINRLLSLHEHTMGRPFTVFTDFGKDNLVDFSLCIYSDDPTHFKRETMQIT